MPGQGGVCVCVCVCVCVAVVVVGSGYALALKEGFCQPSHTELVKVQVELQNGWGVHPIF